jgi:hypothetical protein
MNPEQASGEENWKLARSTLGKDCVPMAQGSDLAGTSQEMTQVSVQATAFIPCKMHSWEVLSGKKGFVQWRRATTNIDIGRMGNARRVSFWREDSWFRISIC